MFCKPTCILAIIFIIGNIYFTLNFDKNLMNTYSNRLNNELLIKYNKIKDERKMISVKGYCLGIITSLILMLLVYKKTNIKYNICIVVATTFIIHYFYYILSNKSDWMILHLHTTEQKKLWLEIYKSCQYNYHFGIFIGLIGSLLLGCSFR